MKTLFIFLALLLIASEHLDAARGGGSRSGGGRSGSSRSGSSRTGSRTPVYRYTPSIRTTASRYTSTLGYNSANRFVYTPSAQSYRYGIHSGSRFGMAIRRQTYWPVGALFLGTRYHYNRTYRRPTSNPTTTQSGLKISDRYTKTPNKNASMSVYDCVLLNGTVGTTCYESVDPKPLSQSEDDEGFSFEDGGCCEDRYGDSICCIIRLNQAHALKGMLVTLVSMVMTSTALILKICR